MDPSSHIHRLYLAARAEGPVALATFLGLCLAYADIARKAIQPVEEPPTVERNIRPAEAAQRLGITVRKLTRERFSTYRAICVPIEGQSRGYVVNERALDVLISRQRVR